MNLDLDFRAYMLLCSDRNSVAWGWRDGVGGRIKGVCEARHDTRL